MTELETPEVVEQPEAAPPPEPWTPERAQIWNRYYDKYVVLGVLLLAFLASANKFTQSTIWTHLRLGTLIAERGGPVQVDMLSSSESGKPWVNPSWLFDWGAAAVYQFAYGLAPAAAPDPAGPAGAPALPDPAASGSTTARAEQVAAGALVAITALLRCVTALLILSIRRPGPGIWWTALTAALALGVAYTPEGVGLGGIAKPANVSPETFGLLFLAIELWLLHRAINLDMPKAGYWLVPLFALWANVDDSFLFGLLVLAAGAIGMKPARGAMLVVACAAACLANPATYQIFPAGFDRFSRLFVSSSVPPTIDQVSIFGSEVQQFLGSEASGERLYYFVLVALGLSSFWLNRRRFSASRFAMFVIASAAWAAVYRMNAQFAVVFATTLGLNGQEWYHDTFGTEGRIGRGWSVWSVGGRALTIVLVFAAMTKGVMGWRSSQLEPEFGFGFNADDFVFEAADYLKSAKFTGNVLNTNLSQADAINWRSYPLRKAFIDSRTNLFPEELRKRYLDVRRALSEDRVEEWKPLLDEYKISVVMVQQLASPRTYTALSQSPSWVPFYDDGAVVMFGRVDDAAPPQDVAFFTAEKLDPEMKAFRNPRPVPAPDLPPTERSLIDSVVQTGIPPLPQPHAQAARRWLQPADLDPNTPYIPDPSRCLLAVRECRIALSKNPNDTVAYRILTEAYRFLLLQESALLNGLALTPQNASQILQLQPQPNQHLNRFRQRLTSLRYAILTSAKPADNSSRLELAERNIELGQLYLELGYADEARDRLQEALNVDTNKALAADLRVRLSQQLLQLNEAVAKAEAALSDLAVDQQASPLQKANFALNQGMAGLAIRELAEAEQSGVGQPGIKPLLLDLYCQTGRPDRAIELLGGGSIDDPTLSDGPGTAAYRNGLVSLLIGNYQNATDIWASNSIRQLRYQEASQGLMAGIASLRGELKSATSAFLELPNRVSNQAAWEYDLAAALLEGGISSDQAAQHFTAALTLVPDLASRPIIAYYLEKLGKPVPPAKRADPAAPAATTPTDPAAPPAATPPAASPAPATTTPAARATEPAAAATPAPAEAPKPEATPKAEAAKPDAAPK